MTIESMTSFHPVYSGLGRHSQVTTVQCLFCIHRGLTELNWSYEHMLSNELFTELNWINWTPVCELQPKSTLWLVTLTRVTSREGTIVCRYNWHSAGSRGWSFPNSNAKIKIYFSNKKYGSNFIKQHSQTVMVWNYQNDDCCFKK